MTVDLSHVKVIDFSRVLAGPFAGQVLAGLGADVIKVELPKGDPARTIGPHVNERSLYFSATNSGKRGIAIDPDDPADRTTLEDLLRWADVIIHNFRREAAESLNVAPAQLKDRHPDLVIVTISGYAEDSSARGRGAFDLTIQAETGFMSVTGEPGGDPLRCGVPLSDLVAGLWAALAVSTGLLTRAREGRGVHIEVPLFDASLPMLSYMATSALSTGDDPPPVGSGHHSVVPYRAYQTRDGYVVIAVLADKFWPLLCEALELRELQGRTDLATGQRRVAARAEIDEHIERACLRRSRQEVLDRLASYGVPSAPVNSVLEALTTEYVRERDLVQDIDTQEGTYSVVRGPYDPPRPLRPAPAIDEHGSAIRLAFATEADHIIVQE